jgi:hypothetical protein
MFCDEVILSGMLWRRHWHGTISVGTVGIQR